MRRRTRKKLQKIAYISIPAIIVLVAGVLIYRAVLPGTPAAPTPTPERLDFVPHTPTVEETAAPEAINAQFEEPAVPAMQQGQVATPLPGVPQPPDVVAAKPDYSFYWFTDTQYYSATYPDTFHGMTEWMRDNIETYNVKYVFHTGDVVNRRGNETQLAVADAAMRTIESELPVFVIAGNHDVGTDTQKYSAFTDHFGKDRYGDNPYTVGWYQDGVGRCDVMTIGDTKYVFLGLSFGAHQDEDAIKWLNKRLKEYRDHHAILFFHDYMQSDGLLSATGRMLYEEVVEPNTNVFMVLCGHRYNSTVLVADVKDDDWDNRRTVYQILMNFQNIDEGGQGYLALIRVYEAEKRIAFDTYSPVLGEWHQSDTERTFKKDGFSLPVDIFE